MPTGYTAGILDGKITTFPQFAKLCMRAFGATIHMRDDDMEEEYKERTPGTYHTENLLKARQALIDVELLSDAEIISNQIAELKDSQQHYENAIIKIQADRIKLDEMLQEAQAWEPPTAEHAGIKEFMISQIKSTIDFDCSGNYYNEALLKVNYELETLSAASVRASIIEKANKDIAYHTKELNEEIERCNKANQWVADLLNSFNAVPAK
jgi:hypothetical protein